MRHLPSIAALMITAASWRVAAAEAPWLEITSAHFTVVSDAGEKPARRVAWQFEQIRGVLERLWPWARLDAAPPAVVFAVRGEAGMRRFVPEYWEQKGAMRPASVSYAGTEGHYILVRTDVDVLDQREVNPYINSYWSYVALVVTNSFPRDLPPWFRRGMASVFSNTIVRSDDITVGQLIPWHLETLRRASSHKMRDVLSVSADSPDLRLAERAEYFDALSWAFVHYLMFGDQGKNLARLNVLAGLLHEGADPEKALAQAYGGLDAVERGFSTYVEQYAFYYRRVGLDVETDARKYTVRPLAAAEATTLRAAMSDRAVCSGSGTDPQAPGSAASRAANR